MITNSQLATAVVFKQLGIRSLATLDDRNIMQREIYLLESVGFPLHFGFVWSLRSAYSEDLMDEAAEIVPCLDSVRNDLGFKPPYQSIIRYLHELEDKALKYGYGRLEWLDKLVSTAHKVKIDDIAKKEYALFRRKSRRAINEYKKGKEA